MQFIFGGAAASSCSTNPKAVAPLLIDTEDVAIAAGTGSALFPIWTGVSGDSAPYGGYVTKNLTCDAMWVKVSYLDGDDCDACTVDTLTTVDYDILIPAGASGVQLPPGYITAIQGQVALSDGTPANSTNGGSARFTSSRAGACGADVLVP